MLVSLQGVAPQFQRIIDQPVFGDKLVLLPALGHFPSMIRSAWLEDGDGMARWDLQAVTET